jgi:hypothetical protein
VVEIPPLADVPLGALDADFEARVRAAPRPVQDRLLAEADLLRLTGEDAASWRALTVYRALVERIEEPGPLHLNRAAWTARESPARDLVQRRLATRALEHPVLDEHAAAVCTLAACEWTAGEFVPAEQRLRALLPEVRGLGDLAELDTYYALACLYAWQRRELEALVMARRALAVAETRSDLHPVHVAHAMSALADAYRSLEDDVGLTSAAQRMLALSTRLAEPDAGRLRRQAYVNAHEAALLRDEVAVAREQLSAAEREHAQDLPTAGRHDTALDYHLARLALREGRPEAATPYLERHLERYLERHLEGRVAARPAHPTLGVLWGLLGVEHDLATGAQARAMARAAWLLERLADPGLRAQIGTGRRVMLAHRLGTLLEGVAGAEPAAGLAWREATDAAYDRLHELSRAERDLPELAAPTAEDHETLARYRSRFLGRHRRLLDRLRDLLASDRARGSLPAWVHASPGGFTAVCAWCRSVRDPAGRWLPLGHFVATSGPHLTVTHGICERCRGAALP